MLWNQEIMVAPLEHQTPSCGSFTKTPSRMGLSSVYSGYSRNCNLDHHVVGIFYLGNIKRWNWPLWETENMWHLVAPPKGAQSKLFFLGTGNRGLEWYDLCVSIFHLPDLLAPLCSCSSCFWWVASCHFACSSSCFLVRCLVPFCVLPVRAFWWVAMNLVICSIFLWLEVHVAIHGNLPYFFQILGSGFFCSLETYHFLRLSPRLSPRRASELLTEMRRAAVRIFSGDPINSMGNVGG